MRSESESDDGLLSASRALLAPLLVASSRWRATLDARSCGSLSHVRTAHDHDSGCSATVRSQVKESQNESVLSYCRLSDRGHRPLPFSRPTTLCDKEAQTIDKSIVHE